MNQNKTGLPEHSGRAGKYFKYAIGEIILVVIGILIALSINNWNQSQKEKHIESQYISNIINDLNEQLLSIEIQMDSEQAYYEGASYLIKDYNEDHTFTLDSLFYKRATLLTSRKTFVITDPAYTDLVSSGNINIIKNQAHKNKLLNYYQEIERIEKVIQNNNSLLVDQQYVSVFQKYGYFYSLSLDEYGVDVSGFPGHLVIPNYETDLQDISKNILLKDENKLGLMNAISFRQNIALGHHALLQEVKTTTQELIKKLEQTIND